MLNQKIVNLPPQPTPFIGRKPEIAEIVDLLSDEQCRLLTLVGPGGIGKTRLSIECILLLSTDAFKHGIYYVPLSQLTSADDIVTTIIGVLGILMEDDGSPREELVKFLSQRNLLLVMDNFEHVLEGADVVSDFLSVAPDVKVLVTSRESLSLQEEWVWQVRGMRFPDETMFDDLEECSALNLFIDRAKRVRHDFDSTENLSDIIRICEMVGGRPLAIELAASWLKSLTCGAIIEEIQRNLDFLATNVRNIPDRHRSIRAVFDHSWHLCEEAEQQVFRRLCVFRGGFTREAAEAIVGATLQTLSALVDKSILQKFPDGRFKLHRLSRQFADEKLENAGETNTLHDAHMHYFANFMQDRTIDIKGRRQLEGLDELDADIINVTKAWSRAVSQADYDTIDKMIEGLALFSDMRSRYQNGEDFFRQAIHQLAPQNEDSIHPVFNHLRARLLQVWLLPERYPIPDHILQLMDDCLTIAEEQADKLTLMLCYWIKGDFDRLGFRLGDHKTALKHYEHALTIARELGTRYYEARILRSIDFVNTYRGFDHSPDALEISQQARAIAQDIGDINGLAHLLFYQSSLQFQLNNYDGVENYIYDALSLWEQGKDIKSIGIVKSNLGDFYTMKGDFALAEECFAEALDILTGVNYLGNHRLMYTWLSLIHSIREQYSQAYEYAQICRSYKWSLPHFHQCMMYYYIATLDMESAEQHLRDLLPYDFRPYFAEIVAYMFVLKHHDEYLRATQLTGFILNYPKGANGWLDHWRLFDQFCTDLEHELGTATYQLALNQGTQFNLDAVVAEMKHYFSDEEAKPTPTLSQPLVEPLTERELEVLGLISDGLTNPQIADKLYLSVGTVKVHTRNIYSKLNVNNRTEAATTARDLKLI